MPTFTDIASQMVEIARSFHARGWTLATSGNFSAVLSRDPLRLAITASGVDKEALTEQDILEIDSGGRFAGRAAAPVAEATAGPRPSAETPLHLMLVRRRGAGAVLHTHSIWSTVLSDVHAGAGGLALQGYEMLKGLQGVSTHEHTEWLPIIENAQDMTALAACVEQALDSHAGVHGFLLRRHGLYTWGVDLAQAKRHVEALEFLLEVFARSRGLAKGEP